VRVPELPPGRELVLPGRGTTFVRELPGPAENAPTLLLLHGWTATADLNFFPVYRALGERYRVVSIDHRGHGRGIRSRRAFRLADCADDAACAMAELGIERYIPVGYSMGGPIAQLIWQRHHQHVDAFVLCATASSFSEGWSQRMTFLGLTGLAGLARLTPQQLRVALTDRLYLSKKAAQWEPWAVHEAANHDWRMVLEAGHAIGNYVADGWLGAVDVPAAVVLTLRDQVVPMERQLRLLELIDSAAAFRVDGPHDSIVSQTPEFLAALEAALDDVTSRMPATTDDAVDLRSTEGAGRRGSSPLDEAGMTAAPVPGS
jgi:3-oxoadipate enol-lactonase